MVREDQLAAISRGVGSKKRRKQHVLFSFNVRSTDEWSEDSSDSDYVPDDSAAPQPNESSPPGHAPEDSAASRPNKSSSKADVCNSSRRKKKSAQPTRKSRRLCGDSSDAPTGISQRPEVPGGASATASAEAGLAAAAGDTAVAAASRLAIGQASTPPTDSLSNDRWGTEMPPEVLMKIFRYTLTARCLPVLCSICRVCRRWYEVGRNADLWTKLDLSYGWIKDRRRLLSCLMNTGRLSRIKVLDLSSWTIVDPKFLLELSGMCPTLEELLISNCTNAREDGIQLVLEKFPRLRVLDVSVSVSSYNCPGDRVARRLLLAQASLFQRATALKELSIAGITCDFSVIECIATYCVALEVLDISNIVLRSKTTHILNLIALMQQHLVKLRVLRMTRALCSAPLRNPSMVDKSAGFPLLEEFSCAADTSVSQASATVASLYHYSGDILVYIIGNSPKLRLLDIHGWSATVLPVLSRLPTAAVEYLYISGLVAPGARTLIDIKAIQLLQWAKTLVDIDLSWMSSQEHIVDHVVTQVFISGSNLRIVAVCGLPIEERHVRMILRACTKLVSLDLSSCHGLPRGMKRRHDTPTSLAALRSAVCDNVPAAAGLVPVISRSV